MSFLFGQKAAEIKSKPKPPVDERRQNRLKFMAKGQVMKSLFKTDMSVEEIAAEFAYQEYLKNKDKP